MRVELYLQVLLSILWWAMQVWCVPAEYGDPASLYFPLPVQNISFIDPNTIIEGKGKFLNNLFSKIPMSPFAFGGKMAARSVLEPTTTQSLDPNVILNAKNKMLNDLFSNMALPTISTLNPSAWIFIPDIKKYSTDTKKSLREIVLNPDLSELDTMKKKSLLNMIDNADLSNKQLRSIVAASPSGSLPIYSGNFDKPGTSVDPLVFRDKILNSISKELSSLKDDMLSTAAEMQAIKSKRPSMFTLFTKPTTPSPVQEKMDLLSKTFDSLSKMEADITASGGETPLQKESFFSEDDEFPVKVSRSLLGLPVNLEARALDNSLAELRRAVSVGLHQGYQSLPPGAVERVRAGAGSDATHEGGGIKLKKASDWSQHRHHHH